MVGVAFWEAEAFCSWAGGRLPTEREWEATARGLRGHEFPWGEPWEAGICNTVEAGLDRTSPVGLFPRARQKELGVEDLSGNVWEWCSVTDISGSRVLRGGSWGYLQVFARVVYRPLRHPDFRSVSYGFRVVCVSPIP